MIRAISLDVNEYLVKANLDMCRVHPGSPDTEEDPGPDLFIQMYDHPTC